MRLRVPGDEAAARDLRLGGRWSRPQAIKNACLRFLVVCSLGVADRLPPAVLLSLGRALGRAVRLISPRLRAMARINAGRALAASVAAGAADHSFEHAGENLSVCLLLRRRRTRALDWVHVPEESEQTLRAALAEGRGVVFVSAHLGPFELVPAAVREMGLPAAIVVRESYDPRLDRFVDSHRRERGIHVIHRGAAGAAIRIVRRLREGLPVGFLPDLGGRVPSLTLPFLGAPFPFPVGPAQIALRAGCPLILGTLRRMPRPHGPPRFELVVERLDSEGPAERLSERVARCVEARITACGAEADYPWMAPRRAVDCGGEGDKGSLVGHLPDGNRGTR